MSSLLRALSRLAQRSGRWLCGRARACAAYLAPAFSRCASFPQPYIASSACARRLALALRAELGGEEGYTRLPSLPRARGKGANRAAAAAAPQSTPAPQSTDAPGAGSRSGAVGKPTLAAGQRRPSRTLMRLRRWLVGGLRLLAYAHIAFIGTTSLLIVCYRIVDPPVTVLALSRKYLDGWAVQRPRPSSMASLPKTLRFMLVAVEDSKFWTHHGFDLDAFKRAAEVNKAIGQPLYGGSTLTMQLARTLFLVPAKSYARKYLELIIALELELILPKERILELYFSWAEWGKGVFGVEAASAWHYKKAVKSLSVSQLARLVAILSSPIRYGPYDVEKRSILKSRYEFLLRKYGG